MRIIGVIPARYHSTRFPGKPLAKIAGKMLIERVWQKARQSKLLDDIIIATDDNRIIEAALGFGARAVLTSRSCSSGTDRVAEVARKIEKHAHYFLNIQGDEPLLSPSLIDLLATTLQEGNADAVTAVYPHLSEREKNNPHVVKAVTDLKGYALYFSRSAVPYQRSTYAARTLKHLGIYGYSRKMLLDFASWKPTPLERTECLEQLRILEKGYRIKTVVSRHDSFGVDVPSDVKKIERLIR